MPQFLNDGEGGDLRGGGAGQKPGSRGSWKSTEEEREGSKSPKVADYPASRGLLGLIQTWCPCLPVPRHGRYN